MCFAWSESGVYRPITSMLLSPSNSSIRVVQRENENSAARSLHNRSFRSQIRTSSHSELPSAAEMMLRPSPSPTTPSLSFST